MTYHTARKTETILIQALLTLLLTGAMWVLCNIVTGIPMHGALIYIKVVILFGLLTLFLFVLTYIFRP